MRDFTTWLHEQLEHRGWTKKELVKRSRLSRETVRGLLNPRRNQYSTTLLTLMKLAQGLSMSMDTILLQLVITDPHVPAYAEVVEIYEQLRPEAREAWVRVGRTLKTHQDADDEL